MPKFLKRFKDTALIDLILNLWYNEYHRNDTSRGEYKWKRSKQEEMSYAGF